jgi:hypothetical protein
MNGWMDGCMYEIVHAIERSERLYQLPVGSALSSLMDDRGNAMCSDEGGCVQAHFRVH